MRKFFLLVLLFCNLIFSLQAQSQFFIKNQNGTSTPISEDVFGSFYELGFDRSDLLWGELLFNRDFEMSKPLGERNPWLVYSRSSHELEDWWHSGYEEQKWFIRDSQGGKKYKMIIRSSS